MEIGDADRKLINEGAVQYFDALRALREFRQVILRLCANVVQRRGEDLAKAMRTRAEINTAKDAVYPDTYEQLLHQAWWPRAWIGRRLNFPDFGYAYFGITCGPESARADKTAGIYAVVGYTTNNANTRDRALPRFIKAGVATILNLDDNDVDTREKLNTAEIHRFPEVLDRMTDQWIKIWEYVGGLPGMAEETEPHSG